MKTGTVYWTNNIVVVSKVYTLCTCWTSNKTEARSAPGFITNSISKLA